MASRESTPLLTAVSQSSGNPEFALEWRGIEVKIPEQPASCLYRLTRGARGQAPVAEKTILHGVSGFVRRGEFLAIMGASGAGKTTLLNVLASRLKPTNGELFVAGTPMARLAYAERSRRVGYVLQYDIFLRSLRVREIMEFASRMRLEATSAAARARAAAIAEGLSLMGAYETVVGDSADGGISGGERKRLGIALEMLHTPEVLLLDEPTSGLDSAAAENVATLLRGLARDARCAIVATIHQPSAEIMQAFDSVMFTAAGQVAYHGPAAGLLPHMAAAGIVVPPHHNPSDVLMRALRAGPVPALQALSPYSGALTAPPITSPTAPAADPAAKSGGGGGGGAVVAFGAGDTYGTAPREVAAPVWLQLGLLARRAAVNMAREPLLTRSRIIQSLVLALMGGGAFFQLGSDSIGMTTRGAAIFFILINQMFGPLMGILNTFPAERALMQHEVSSGLYSLPAYFSAKVAVEGPVVSLFPLLATSIFYFMAGLRPGVDHFWIFSAYLVILTLVSQGLGMMISAATRSVTVALSLGPIVMLPFLLFGGFFSQAGTIPVAFRWINTISFVRFAYQAVIIDQFRAFNITNPETGEPCPESPRTQACPFPTGDALMEYQYGINSHGDPSWYNTQLMLYATYLVAFVVGTRLIAFIILYISHLRSARRTFH